jgi:hypothetical protein
MEVFNLSSKTAEGMDAYLEFLHHHRLLSRAAVAG